MDDFICLAIVCLAIVCLAIVFIVWPKTNVGQWTVVDMNVPMNESVVRPKTFPPPKPLSGTCSNSKGKPLQKMKCMFFFILFHVLY